MTSKQNKISEISSAPVDALRYVGRKTLRKLQGRSNENLTAAPDADSFGRSMMEKLGWKEGSGIGKNLDGMTTHIRATKRGGEGLGSKGNSSQYEGDNAKSCLEDGWYLKVFDDARKAKKSKKSKKSKKRKRDSALPSSTLSSSCSPVIPTDAELFKATGGARLGRRAQPRGGERGKMKRIAAADAEFLAKFSGGGDNIHPSKKTGSITTEASLTETVSPSKKRSKKEFRWKKVIRKEIDSNKTLTLKLLKKNVIKVAKKALPNMPKDELKKKFDSKWNKLSTSDKSRVTK